MNSLLFSLINGKWDANFQKFQRFNISSVMSWQPAYYSTCVIRGQKSKGAYGIHYTTNSTIYNIINVKICKLISLFQRILLEIMKKRYLEHQTLVNESFIPATQQTRLSEDCQILLMPIKTFFSREATSEIFWTWNNCSFGLGNSNMSTTFGHETWGKKILR